MRRILKQGTQEAHDRVEGLPFMKVLTDEGIPLPPQLLRDHISHKLCYLSTLERLLSAQEDTYRTLSPHLLSLLHFFKALYRTDSLLHTAHHLDALYHTTPTPSTSSRKEAYVAAMEYARYLEGLAREAPVYLIFHGWVNLCDGVFGGSLIASAISRRLGEDAAQFVRYPHLLPRVRDEDSGEWKYLEFPESLAQVLPWYLEHFQTPLEAIPWETPQIERAIAEANTAFNALYTIGSAINLAEYIHTHHNPHVMITPHMTAAL